MKKTVLTVVAVLAVGYAGYSIMSAFGTPDDIREANTRILRDSNTGELVAVEITLDTPPYPLKNKSTGTNTLYPTEVCWARECGNLPEGTRVILNAWLKKDGPTYCQNCGALVVPRNPDARKRGQ